MPTDAERLDAHVNNIMRRIPQVVLNNRPTEGGIEVPNMGMGGVRITIGSWSYGYLPLDVAIEILNRALLPVVNEHVTSVQSDIDGYRGKNWSGD